MTESETTSSTGTAPFAELQVPGEPGVWFCARHKSTRTRLRCGRCEKPICPRCTVMAPTGARCADCASNRTSHIYQVSGLHLLVSALAAGALGAFGVMLLGLAGGFSLWLVLYAPIIGPALGKVITRVTGGKRGPRLAASVCGGMVLGGVAMGSYQHAAAARALARLSPEQLEYVGNLGATPWPFILLFLVLAVAGAWWWLK